MFAQIKQTQGELQMKTGNEAILVFRFLIRAFYNLGPAGLTGGKNDGAPFVFTLRL